MTEDEERHADEVNIAFQMGAEWERKQTKARIKKLEAALRDMLAKCAWAKREKWCGTIDCHCQIARKALEGKGE
jgi:hypothetical protein